MLRSSTLAVFAALAASAHARTLGAGAGKQFPVPSAAIAAAEPGEMVAIYPGQYFDCAVVQKEQPLLRHPACPSHQVARRRHRSDKMRHQDGPDGTAIYEVEAPNGGSVILRNSTIVKGPSADNHTAAIMIGSEGVTQRTPEIIVENSTFRNDGSYPTIFVDNLTAIEAQLSGNYFPALGRSARSRATARSSPASKAFQGMLAAAAHSASRCASLPSALLQPVRKLRRCR